MIKKLINKIKFAFTLLTVDELDVQFKPIEADRYVYSSGYKVRLAFTMLGKEFESTHDYTIEFLEAQFPGLNR